MRQDDCGAERDSESRNFPCPICDAEDHISVSSKNQQGCSLGELPSCVSDLFWTRAFKLHILSSSFPFCQLPQDRKESHSEEELNPPMTKN